MTDPIPTPDPAAARTRPARSPPSTSATARRRCSTTRSGCRELAGWSANLPRPSVDPHRQRPLADRADGDRRHDHGPAGLRLLRLPAALLPVRVPLPRRARAGRDGQVADARQRAHPRPPDPWPRPRRLGAAARDVPGRGHPRAPDVDARPRPGAPVRGRPAARAAARRGRADRRLGVHDPRPAVHRRVLRGQARRARSGRSSSTAGWPRPWSAATSTACSPSARRRRACRSRTRRSSTSRRCS